MRTTYAREVARPILELHNVSWADVTGPAFNRQTRVMAGSYADRVRKARDACIYTMREGRGVTFAALARIFGQGESTARDAWRREKTRLENARETA